MGLHDIEPIGDDERAAWPKTVLVDLAAAHRDERGAIQPMVDAAMKSCVMITSKAGAVRANHYHRTDWHYCYVLSGRLEYSHRPVGSTAAPERLVVGAGQMVFTPPMVEHAMRFLEDTVFFAWGRNSRAQAVYEADVVRIAPIHD